MSASTQVFKECGVQVSRVPPPKMKIVREVGTSALTWFRVPPPPIEKFGQDLGLSVLSCQELPLTQQEHGGNECVETNCCILHGYRLIITGFRLNYGRYFGKESRL